MSGDLMELVEAAQATPAQEAEAMIDLAKEAGALKQAQELLDLGMTKVGQDLFDKADRKRRMRLILEGKYIAIEPRHIMDFLQRKAKQIDKEAADEFQRNNAETIKQMRGWASEALNDLRNVDYVLRPGRESFEKYTMGDFRPRMITSDDVAIDQFRVTTSDSTSVFRQVDSNELARLMGQQQAAFDNQRFGMLQNQAVSRWGVSPLMTGLAMESEALSVQCAKGRVTWIEVDVQNYEGVPPPHALSRLKDERGKCLFDSYSIASVLLVKDPLLLGRVKGSDKRFFLAQWGEDVKIDDLI